MGIAELKNDLFYLISYIVSSARGLYDEPADYGTFRLIDSAGRLLAIMETHGLDDPFTARLRQSLDEEREGNMDNETQREHLDQMILDIVQEMQNR